MIIVRSRQSAARYKITGRDEGRVRRAPSRMNHPAETPPSWRSLVRGDAYKSVIKRYTGSRPIMIFDINIFLKAIEVLDET